MKKIYVSDQTLRVLKEENKKALSFREKLAIATNLVKTGVDAIELPFISLSKEDSVIYRTIAKSVGGVTVCIPCNFSVEGVREAYDCVKDAENFRLQVVVPVSTVQMEYIYHLKAPKMLEKVAEIVKFAISLHNDVEVIMKDATRAEEGFVVKLAKVCKENGANTVTLCDDGGVFFPEEFAKLVSDVCETGVNVYVNPSDALNMATATAISSIKAGASGVKTASTTGLALKTNNFAEVLRAKGSDLAITSNLDITAIHNVVKNIEGGIENAKNFILPFLNNAVDKDEVTHLFCRDYKTALQEIAQQNPGEIIRYTLLEESGPDHEKKFSVNVYLNSNLLATGFGKSKKEAEQDAAHKALILMGEE